MADPTQTLVGKGFAFFAEVRMRWTKLPTACRGIRCPTPGCAVRWFYREEWSHVRN